MGRGYTGESKEDIAYRKIEKMNRRNKTPQKRAPSNLLESLQEAFPDTWRDEIEKMKREYAEQNRNK